MRTDLEILVRIFQLSRLPLIVCGEDCIWDVLQPEPSPQGREIKLRPRIWAMTSRKTMAIRCDIVSFIEIELLVAFGETESFVMEGVLAC
ncbi:uncharacterized protein Bfra_004198 [Botrytis fragariae]|uniref:Uncharacterized protein n=1 Tax=Botrytis fragariae TaxID=1964551 RepID=A0A8H6AV24_9HELO|nr:uncharacterized protein Bfra_004198 [Botrytis fragariae]KAF5874192.1 hypothetical protein Bfra_004198 [Botrytis fragariae]